MENSRLSDTKQKLLEKYLTGRATPEVHVSSAIPRRPAGEPVPLSFPQQQVWLQAQLAGEIPIYNEAITIYRRGPLDVTVLELCMVETLRRHEIWRTTFEAIDGKPIQVVQPAPDRFPLEMTDLRHLNESEKDAEARRLATENAQKPFDLKKGPLLRGILVRLDEEEYRLYMTFHQLVFDAVSAYRVFLPELSAMYEAFSAGKPSPLPEPTMQYGDFAHWQHRIRSDNTWSKQFAFWRKKLSGELPVLPWPNDHTRPLYQTYRGTIQRFKFDPSLMAPLRAFCQEEGVSSYMTLLASFVALLSRYTGQKDIVVGGLSAGRKWPDVEPLVGDFVNPLALRVDLSGNPTFRQLTKQAMSVVLDALANEDVPFENVVEGMQLRPDPSRNPVFQIIVSQQPQLAGVAQGWNLATEEVSNGGSKSDMMIVLDERPDAISGPITYNLDLFDVSTVTRMVEHWQKLLTAALMNPEARIADLPLLTDAELAQILVEWNKTQAEYPKDACLHDLFEAQVKRTPDAVAFKFEGARLSYHQLNERANQLAHYLQRSGIGPEGVVGVCVERSLEMVVGVLGVLKAGGAYLPLDPTYPRERLAYMLEDARVEVLVSQCKLMSSLPKHGARTVCLDADWERIAQECTELPASRVTAESPAYVYYTSGSTGRPKGVLGTHRGAVNRLSWMWKAYPFRTGEICCQKTSLSFVDSVWEIFGPLLQGVPTMIISDNRVRDMNLLIETLAAEHVTRIVLVPSQLRAILDQLGGFEKKLPELKLWVSSGEALMPDVAQRFLNTIPGSKLLNLYGSSEVAADVTCCEVRSDDTIGIVPIGRPIANTQVYVLDSHRNPMPVGVGGEIYVGGEGLACGYLNQPELTAEKFVVNPFGHAVGSRLYKTGDLGRYLPDGNIEYLGRLDQQVKIRGFRIELGEIEAVLSRHEAVSQCIVVAREDASGDKILVAYLEPLARSVFAVGDLRAHLKQELPEYMIPSAFVVMENLPLTPNGKIDRKALPPPGERRIDVQGKFVSPRDPMEQALAQIWAKILGAKRVGLDSDFFELGGHSLAAVRMLFEVQKLVGKTIPLATLFQASTVEAFAEILRREGWTPSWSSLVPMQPLGSKCPLFLVHGAEGNVLLYRHLIQYLGPDQPVYGLQSRGLNGDGRLNTTIQQVASHYVKEVMTVQPHGPYLLGGYCLGGIIAFEMAQQFSALDEEVALVVMLDSYNPSAASLSRLSLKAPLHFLQNLWFHFANVALIRSKDRRKFLTEKVDIELARLGIRLHAGYQFLQRACGGMKSNNYPHLAIKKVNDQAWLRYVPQAYGGRVVVIRSKGHFLGFANPSLGWNGIVRQGLEIHELPLYPKGMLVEPFCRLLAETLKLCLQNI